MKVAKPRLNLHAVKLLLEYEGTRYSGWQEQINARTVSGELRAAAEKFLRTEVTVLGAGRTDAGVHALAQAAVIKTQKHVNAAKLPDELNRFLPQDINVLHAENVDSNFHPRHDALLRVYLYQIATRRTALAKRFVWWIREPLNLAAMQEACSLLIGRHDFERFADKRREDGSTIVLVERVELDQQGELILFRIGASHFLWKMVRRVVGVLVQVARGKLSAAQFESLIKAEPLHKSMQAVSIPELTAPASGLFLERVTFDESEQIPPLRPIFTLQSFSHLS